MGRVTRQIKQNLEQYKQQKVKGYVNKIGNNYTGLKGKKLSTSFLNSQEGRDEIPSFEKYFF